MAAWRVMDQGDRVGGLVFDDSCITEVRPHRSRRRVLQLLGAVVEKNNALRVDAGIAANGRMLNQALEQVLRSAKHDALITVISDFHGQDDDTLRLLIRMAQHNDVICALVYDPIKTRMPEAGRLVVTDGDLQLELDTSKARHSRKLSDYFDEDLKKTKEQLAKVGVPVMLIHTAADPVEQIREQLGHVRGGSR